MIVIVLPWPAQELWANRSHGRHWSITSAATAQAREDARLLTLEALAGMRPAITGARLVFTFCPPTKRRFDIANALAALKGACDGIADCLGIDDATFNPIELKRGEVVQHGSVVVEVYFQ